MLVIDRKEGEGFWIGSDIYVKVLRSRQNRLSIGIQAPSEVVIRRGELEKDDQSKQRTKHRTGPRHL